MLDTRFDAVCVGESMALLTPVQPRPLVERPLLQLDVGGAESNVACGLAGLGHRTAWVSRIGADPFGEVVLAAVRDRAVDVGHVEVDPDRPTGVYFKDPGPVSTRVHYYRRGSAASTMGPGLTENPALLGARLVHLTGVLPALSDSCAALTRALVESRRPGRLVSVDVNYRPRLWPSPEVAATVLADLARRADVLFVGRDEAATLWGSVTADDVHDLFADVHLLVVKDAEHGATSYEAGTRTHVPALRVQVLEPVGCGDAFAAGYLSGLLDGRAARDRLRLGHQLAAETLQCVGDLAPPPPRDLLERRTGLTDEAWSQLHLPLPAPGARR